MLILGCLAQGATKTIHGGCSRRNVTRYYIIIIVIDTIILLIENVRNMTMSCIHSCNNIRLKNIYYYYCYDKLLLRQRLMSVIVSKSLVRCNMV